MKHIIIASFTFTVFGLIIVFSNKRRSKLKNELIIRVNNLSKELEIIDDSLINTGETNIDNILNEQGFLKTNFDSLNENDKINYSLLHGYL